MNWGTTLQESMLPCASAWLPTRWGSAQEGQGHQTSTGHDHSWPRVGRGKWKCGIPNSWTFFLMETPFLKWMITRGPILGNLQIVINFKIGGRVETYDDNGHFRISKWLQLLIQWIVNSWLEMGHNTVSPLSIVMNIHLPDTKIANPERTVVSINGHSWSSKKRKVYTVYKLEKTCKIPCVQQFCCSATCRNLRRPKSVRLAGLNDGSGRCGVGVSLACHLFVALLERFPPCLLANNYCIYGRPSSSGFVHFFPSVGTSPQERHMCARLITFHCPFVHSMAMFWDSSPIVRHAQISSLLKSPTISPLFPVTSRFWMGIPHIDW